MIGQRVVENPKNYTDDSLYLVKRDYHQAQIKKLLSAYYNQTKSIDTLSISKITWTQAKNIFANNCYPCHQTDNAAPFSLVDYNQ
ncbi:MAG: hypothetical protein U0T69_04525, partial [Chitinophagales bacterium]